MTAWLSMMFVSAMALTDPSIATASPSIPTPMEMLFVAADRRVRTTESRVTDLLREGARRSPTFAGLLTTLNRTDVIVYIERVMTLPKETMGRLTMVPIPGPHRYLRIQIRADLPSTEAIALIGHEMRHALEVAEALDVRDEGGMIRLYRRIGHSSGGEHVYDTLAAQAAGRQVRRELLS